MLIKVDRSQLNQVIINLVINAIDAMERKGTLTLRTYCDKGKKKRGWQKRRRRLRLFRSLRYRLWHTRGKSSPDI